MNRCLATSLRIYIDVQRSSVKLGRVVVAVTLCNRIAFLFWLYVSFSLISIDFCQLTLDKEKGTLPVFSVACANVCIIPRCPLRWVATPVCSSPGEEEGEADWAGTVKRWTGLVSFIRSFLPSFFLFVTHPYMIGYIFDTLRNVFCSWYERPPGL